MRNQQTLYVHESPDLDAFFSLCAAWEFIPYARDAKIEFVPVNWNGRGMGPDDMAFDMEAGGRGIKGVRDADGKVHSCFATIVAQYASPEAQRALQELVQFVDTQDTDGSVVQKYAHMLPKDAQDMIQFTSINAVLRAFQNALGDDLLVLERMSEMFSGFLKSGKNRIRGREEADAAKYFHAGKIALLENPKKSGTINELFSRGVRVVVLVDGFDLRVKRGHGDEDGFRVDHPSLIAVIEQAGEKVSHEGGQGDWFAHSAGFLLARGGRKGERAKTPSKVNPYDLIDALEKILP